MTNPPPNTFPVQSPSDGQQAQWSTMGPTPTPVPAPVPAPVAALVPNASPVLNGTFAVADNIGDEADTTLRLVSRLGALVAVMIFIVIIVLACKSKAVRDIVAHKCTGLCDAWKVGCCRARYWKSFCINVFGCGCIPKVHESMGYEELSRPQMSLVMQFMAVKDLQRSGRFYFEVWSEPDEHPHKNTSSFTGPGDSTMSGERVELDWHGDEDKLIIAMNLYNGNQAAMHQPVGEVQLSLKDCMEIANGSDGGLRRLTLEVHDDIELKKRLVMRKTNPVTNPQALIFKQGVQSMQQLSYEKFGEEYPDSGEMDGLRSENAALRKKLDQIDAGKSSKEIPRTSNTRLNGAGEKIVDVVVKFSIDKKDNVDHKTYNSLKSMRTNTNDEQTFSPLASSPAP